MREILFRGKEINTGKWAYGNYYYEAKNQNTPYYITWNGKDALGNFGDRYNPVNNVIVEPETIGQYTGLKDENGTKIFEGDIVKRDEGIYKIGFGHHIAPCSDYPYDYGTAYGFYLESDDKFSIDKDDVLEIIGDIYDNPELLEE